MCTGIYIYKVYISHMFVLVVLIPQYTYPLYFYWSYLCPSMYICIYILAVLIPCLVEACAPASWEIKMFTYGYIVKLMVHASFGLIMNSILCRHLTSGVKAKTNEICNIYQQGGIHI